MPVIEPEAGRACLQEGEGKRSLRTMPTEAVSAANVLLERTSTTQVSPLSSLLLLVVRARLRRQRQRQSSSRKEGLGIAARDLASDRVDRPGDRQAAASWLDVGAVCV